MTSIVEENPGCSRKNPIKIVEVGLIWAFIHLEHRWSLTVTDRLAIQRHGVQYVREKAKLPLFSLCRMYADECSEEWVM